MIEFASSLPTKFPSVSKFTFVPDTTIKVSVGSVFSAGTLNV